MDNLPIEGRIERPRLGRTDKRRRINIHRRHLDIRQEPGPVVKDGAIVESSFLLKHGDVVQMSVIVQKQRVRLKEQRQILREHLETGKRRRLFGKPLDPLFVAGQARQGLLQGTARPFIQMGQCDDGLPRLQKICAGAAVAIPPSILYRTK